MNKRIACVLLVLVLCFAFIGQNICVVDAAINTTTFNTKVQEFIKDSRWKNGISWGDNQAPKLSKWSSVGCCAYAADFVAYVYGSATAAWTASGFTKFTNLNEIRVGDVIHITGHWFVVIERNGDNFKTVEGNVDDKVRVSSDAWGIKNGKLHHLKASSSECTFEYGYHYNFSDSNSSNLSSTQIYYNIDMSSSVLASRTNQQVSGDCAVVSMVTVESYLYGAKTAAEKNAVYKALVNKNGDDNYAYWSNCGYVSHSSVNWATVYEQLSIGYPVIVHRPATSSNSQHWAVVAGYKGSTTKLEKDKFIIVDVYHGSGGKDIYTSADWRGSVAIDRMVTRKNGMNITSLSGIRMAIDHPSIVHKSGNGHGVLGYIASNENLTSVRVMVTNAYTGTNVYNKTVTPNAKSYLIFNLDSEMTFAKWAVGEYFFTVVAQTANKTKTYQSYFEISSGWPYTIPTRSYTFSFDSNGGSGDVADQIVNYGNKLTIPTTTPTRNGYKFVGWTVVRSTDNTSYYSKGEWLSNNQAGSSDAKKIYKPGDVYSINYDWVKGSFTNRNYTFYAVWEANAYTVSYNANGGTGAPGNQTKTYGVALTLSTTKPTRTGYTFLGWSTSSSATSATYQPGGSFTSNANTTLYAVWKKGCESNNHNYTTKVTPPTCTEKGYTTHTCTSCGDNYKDTYTNIINHDYANGKCTHCGAVDPNYVIDQNAAQMTIDSVTATCGQTVTVNITAKNMSQVKTLLIDSFAYNKDALEFVSGTLKLNNAAISDWNDREMIASVAFSNNTNINGVVLTLTFKVKDGAEGEYSISCEAYSKKLQNGQEESIIVSVISGKINVTKQMRGDMDGNNIVNSDDAINLLRHTLFADRYPINQSGDMNRDGIVNSDDAIHLLRHTLFPSIYPLK